MDCSTANVLDYYVGRPMNVRRHPSCGDEMFRRHPVRVMRRRSDGTPAHSDRRKASSGSSGRRHKMVADIPTVGSAPRRSSGGSSARSAQHRKQQEKLEEEQQHQQTTMLHFLNHP